MGFELLKTENMTNEQIRERLQALHKAENELNKELSTHHKEIMWRLKKKEVLTKQISKNMKYRNYLINKLK